MKKKEEQLVRKVTDMIQKTREGKLHWDIQCQTTEYNDLYGSGKRISIGFL